MKGVDLVSHDDTWKSSWVTGFRERAEEIRKLADLSMSINQWLTLWIAYTCY